MKKENLHMIIGLGIVLILLFSGSLIIKNVSGVNPPFTVVESQSMQHSPDKSQIGIIDTADMILVQHPTKTKITTYVEGSKTGYESFGDFGSVIVYKRITEGNPIIHRAMIELIYEDSTWKAPSLKDYSGLWNCSSGDYNNISGTLTIEFQRNYKPVTVDINVDALQKKSGYLTMGDNNSIPDQTSTISSSYLVSSERIKSVAWKEIPWIGAIKLIVNDKEKSLDNVTNTIPNLGYFFFTLILSIIAIGFILDNIQLIRMKKNDPHPFISTGT